MRLVQRFGLAAVVACASASTTLANGVLYDCDIPEPRGSLGWLPTKMAIVFHEDGRVDIVDNVRAVYELPPAKPRVRVRGEVTRLGWSLTGVQDSAGTYVAGLNFTARLNRSNNTIDVVASFSRTPQRWRSKGTCTTRTE